jgi:D-lactate dehydrogenase
MRLAVFDTHRFEREFFERANGAAGHELVFFENRLNRDTAPVAAGFEAVCAFVNDRLDRETLGMLAAQGTRFIALRCAGFNHVDLEAARALGIRVARVPEYSPYAVAEHAVALILALNRGIPRAHARVRDGNFSLDGLTGFDLHGKTVGIVGTGRIGSVLARILHGFGMRILAYDTAPSPELTRGYGVAYVGLKELYRSADVVSLHVPLTPETRHLINHQSIALMKPGVMLINTGRGALIETPALVSALKSGQVGYAGLDVYEEEEGFFFNDLSGRVLQDDVLARLLTFPNVLITAHQGFLTREALERIAQTTLRNVTEHERKLPLSNEVLPASSRASA